MRTHFLLGLSGLAFACATPAQADSYFQVTGGPGFSGEVDASATVGAARGSAKQDLDGGWVGSVAVGKQLSEAASGLALEGELVFQGADVETPSLDTLFAQRLNAKERLWGAMANAKYYFAADNAVSPYVGVGGGYGRVTYEFFGAEEENSGFMWQAIAGVTFNLWPEAAIDVGYRYIDAPEWSFSDPTIPSTLELNAVTHAVTGGVKLKF